MAKLYEEVRGAPLGFGPYAGLSIIDSIKRAYSEIDGGASIAPVAAEQPAQPVAPAPAAAPAGPPATVEGPEQLNDDDIAKSFIDPVQRFAALSVKYGGQPPKETLRHFSLLDELQVRDRR